MKAIDSQTKQTRGSSFSTGLLLQRKCDCGNHAMGGECGGCAKKKNLIQRRSSIEVEPPGVPAIVDEVLRSTGRPLDRSTRNFFEPKFGHDFSNVRVHSDSRAAESARAVNAQAYTVGRQLVFGDSQYAPDTTAGRRLLAHELTHVIQQKENSAAAFSNSPISSPTDRHEQEADRAVESIEADRPAVAFSPQSTKVLQRKVVVENPKKKIANPTGKGLDQTNAATVADYCGQLCTGEQAKVDEGTGEVSMSVAFCSEPILQIGHEALPGGPAPATEAKTATGCTCLCDLASSKNVWTIRIDDGQRPHTNFKDDDAATGVKPGGSGGVVTTISPNSPKVFGSVTTEGKKVDYDPWLILGHELCGHGWLADRGQAESLKVSTTIGRQPFTVDRENALRAEHALAARSRSFRDPFCGESYERFKAGKVGTETFDPGNMELCTTARARCKKPNKGLFKIDERIPETVSC